jgi:hypothetical protein
MGTESIGFNGVPSETLLAGRPTSPFSTSAPIGNPYNAAPWNSQNGNAGIYGDWGTH